MPLGFPTQVIARLELRLLQQSILECGVRSAMRAVLHFELRVIVRIGAPGRLGGDNFRGDTPGVVVRYCGAAALRRGARVEGTGRLAAVLADFAAR